MKKIIGIFCVIAIVASLVSIGYASTDTQIETTTSEAYIPSETSTTTINSLLADNERINTNNIEKLERLINESSKRMKAAKKMKKSACDLGYEENHTVILLAEQEYEIAKSDNDFYKTKLKEVKEKFWNRKKKENPIATKIWLYFKEIGYNDYICAGILGNIMAEVGGQTLNIRHMVQGNGYYGMCQWSTYYSPHVVGKNLEEQCEHLSKTIKKAMDNYGNNYYSGFNYEKFLELNDEKAAALAFALCYERCSSASHNQRQLNATVAYEYFV